VNRSDPVSLFIVSFIGGIFVSVAVLGILDPPDYAWSGVGCLCTAAIAALVYRKQQGRRY
jgi:hypothetical protein